MKALQQFVPVNTLIMKYFEKSTSDKQNSEFRQESQKLWDSFLVLYYII